MKIFILYMACILLFFGTGAVYAAPVGSTAAPAVLKSALISKDESDAVFGIVGGFEADITNDRKLNSQAGKTDLRFYDAKIGLTLYDRAMVYGLVGTGRLETKINFEGTEIKFESNTDLSWGMGATAVVFEKLFYDIDSSILRIGLDGRYRTTRLEADRVNRGAIVYELPRTDVTDTDIDYSDWQIAGVVSWQWKRLIPYIGAKYSDADSEVATRISGTMYKKDIDANKNAGIFFGTDLVIKDPISDTDCLFVNIEYRILDEEALSLACAIRF